MWGVERALLFPNDPQRREELRGLLTLNMPQPSDRKAPYLADALMFENPRKRGDDEPRLISVAESKRLSPAQLAIELADLLLAPRG